MTQNDDTNDQGKELEITQGEPENKMGALLEEEGLNIDFPKEGETRDGMIASISEGQILVSVGAKSEGLINGKDYESIPPDHLSKFEVGNVIPVYVVKLEDQNGNLILSYVKAIEEQSWNDAEALMEANESFESTIVAFNRGGLLVPLGTIRGFVPASQISRLRGIFKPEQTPEERYKDMIGEKIEVRVIEVDRERSRLILSERAANTETRDMIKDKVINDLTEGDVRTGRVTSFANFGAFVNINGADGLVHLSEISWDHVNHASDVLEIGQEVQVKIISIDSERRRIGLSIRQLQEHSWSINLKVGQLVEAEITRLANFGAFAKLKMEAADGDLEGLVHISEISDRRIEHPKEVLHVGDIVTLRVIKIDEDSQRIGLSLRRVDSPAYADLDWKNLTEGIELSPPSDEGEDIAAFATQETEETIAQVVAEETEATETKAQDEVEDTDTEITIAEVEAEETDAEEPIAQVEVEETDAKETIAEVEAEETGAKETIAEVEAEETGAEDPIAQVEAKETDAEVTMTQVEAEETDAEEPIAQVEVEETDAEETIAEVEVEETDAEEPIAQIEIEETGIEEPITQVEVKETDIEEPIAQVEVEEIDTEETIAEIVAEETEAEETSVPEEPEA